MLSTPRVIRGIRWGVCAAIAAAIIAGLYVSGSPTTQRRYAFDERRVSSLNQLSQAIDTYAARKNTIPPSLELLAQDQPHLVTELRDPATNALYEYAPHAGSTSTYDLCATFDLARERDPQEPAFAPTRDFWENPLFSIHEAGRDCFSLRVRDYPQTNIPTPVIKPVPASL